MKHMKKQIMMLLAVLCLLFGTTTTNAQTPRIKAVISKWLSFWLTK